MSDRTLLDYYSKLSNDPLGFVKFAFPWGVPGSEIEHMLIEQWQADILSEIGARLSSGVPTQLAIRSGHGVGKSTLCAWVAVWALLTRERTKVILTANTELQLRTKTMPEVQKWLSLTAGAKWFDTASTYIRSIAEPSRWSLEATPWSAASTTGFQGTHNRGNRTVFLLDEAADIPQEIFVAAQGGVNDAAQGIILAAGNPSTASGAFFECFNKNRKYWVTRTIDSREVSFANRAFLDQLLEQYGANSDEARVRVYGLPPIADSATYIRPERVEEAMSADRQPEFDAYAPCIIGVDVAKGLTAGDRSVIAVRHGFALPALQKYQRADEMSLVGHVVDAFHRHKADIAFVDEVGVGSGVVSRLKQLGYNVVGVNGGSAASDKKRYRDKNAEMWARMKEWLAKGKLPRDSELSEDMCKRKFDYDGASGALSLESVRDMRARGLASPDLACALSYTFAENVARRDTSMLLHKYNIAASPYTKQQHVAEYDVLNWS
jgi:hypothetical protein